MARNRWRYLLDLVVPYGWGAMCIRLPAFAAARGEDPGILIRAFVVVGLLAVIPVSATVLACTRPRLRGPQAILVVLLSILAAAVVASVEVFDERIGELLLTVFSGPVFLAADLASWAAIGLAAGVALTARWRLRGKLRPACLLGFEVTGLLVGWGLGSRIANPTTYGGITLLATPPLLLSLVVVSLSKLVAIPKGQRSQDSEGTEE